ncbi:galanin receptor type 1-like [Mytilus californianus]|uniref:galanin receptor type 1-like n=1 Tax=Mytilus californianus TaxID=6549 RepID=UPI0022456006|nr:galanin receptor type 1-like [Mytilus californianus]
MEINTDDNISSSEYILVYVEDLNISVAEALVDTPEWEYRFAVPAIFLIFMITGMLGNGLVVLVFIKNKTFRTITNMFLLNLAVTDLMYLSFCVPFGATRYYKGYWIFGNTLCKFVQYMMTVCLSLHVLTLTAVGIDRYLAIVHPIIALSIRTKKRCIFVIFCIWFLSLSSFMPVIFINREFKASQFMAFCLEELSETDSKIYAIAMLVLFYVIPQCILGFCYLQIARRMKETMTKSRLAPVTLVSMKRRGRLVRLVAIVALAFAISWLPLHMAAIISVSSDNSNSAFIYHLQNVAPCFSYANSVVNPFIYSFMSKTFRKFFKATFKCRSINITSSLLVDDADAVVSTHDRRHRGLELRSVRNRATQTPRSAKTWKRERKPVPKPVETPEETVTLPLVESLL